MLHGNILDIPRICSVFSQFDVNGVRRNIWLFVGQVSFSYRDLGMLSRRQFQISISKYHTHVSYFAQKLEGIWKELFHLLSCCFLPPVSQL